MRLPAPLSRLLERFGPWLLPLAAIGAFWELVGGGWDINSHLRRLPEFFWTPPHIALYSGAAFVLLTTGAAYALRWTSSVPPASQRFASAIAFGGAALQFVAGGFDSWWHATYGPDDAFSPPHILLTSAILITAIGVVVALHAWRRTARPTGRLGTFAWVSHAIGVTAIAWAAWGFLFILLFPGFNAGRPLIPSEGLRLFTGAAYASLFPMMLLAAVRVVGRRGAATVSATTQFFGFYLIQSFLGEAPGGLVIGLGIVVFVLPGVAADFLYRPGTKWADYVAIGFGAVLGLWGFLAGGIVDDMTRPDTWPVPFALAFVAGGVAGALLAMMLGERTDGLAARDSGPSPTPA
ncbi:MAG TPA: hypothetical protein VGR51_00575 [Thermoplasmata archaeon]|jgi:hypothetical protein|nr:hypothetical protein [Thermoplasmata archaeon]